MFVAVASRSVRSANSAASTATACSTSSFGTKKRSSSKAKNVVTATTMAIEPSSTMRGDARMWQLYRVWRGLRGLPLRREQLVPDLPEHLRVGLGRLRIEEVGHVVAHARAVGVLAVPLQHGPLDQRVMDVVVPVERRV